MPAKPSQSNERLVAQLRTTLRRELPSEAFAANPSRLLDASAYLVLIFVGYLLIRARLGLGVDLAMALLIGGAQLSLGFISHDMSHGSVIRDRRWRTWLESALWAVNSTPASVWIVNHNRVHHLHTNAPTDVFRYPAQRERSPGRTLFALLFLPNRHLPWNPLVLLTYLIEISTFTSWALVGVPRVASSAANKERARFRGIGRVRLIAEVLAIGAVQFGVFVLVGAELDRLLWSTLIPVLLGSAGASLYLFSQHGLQRLSTADDPLGSTSLRLPGFIDRLHSNLGHHTAHHLFPTLSSNHYPAVTQLLAAKPELNFERLGMLECWRQLMRNDLYKPDPRPERQDNQNTQETAETDNEPSSILLTSKQPITAGPVQQ